MKQAFYILLFGLLAPALAQSAVGDSIKTKPRLKSSDVDTMIKYDALEFDNRVKERKSYFTGNAVINYKNMTLKAAKIEIDWDTNILIAEGMPDTVWVKKPGSTDSTQTVTTTGEPVMEEGGTTMTGRRMVFNYKTQKGVVVRGRTRLEDGFYVGSQIKMVKKNVFNVSNSMFTTCDLDSNPHFHFSTQRLKMIVNDRVIAQPIIPYIGHIPIFYIPFAFFPTKSGRHSGIIIPSIAASQREGRYLRNLGYYWAASQYWDARATIDIFEKTGFLLDMGFNYAVRYKLTGSINGSWTNKTFKNDPYSYYNRYYGQNQGGYKEKRWDLTVQHNQEIDRNTRISASGYFVSDNSFYQDLSTSLNARLTRELRSNATFSKYWPKQKISLSANASQVRDLQDNTTTTTLPQMTLRLSQTQLFDPKKSKGSREEKWYHSLYFDYGSNLYNTRREYLDRTNIATPVKQVDTQRQLDHAVSLSLTSPKKYFGILSVNQSMAIESNWFDRSFDYYLDSQTKKITSREKKNFAHRETFSYSASASTKMYGVIAPGIGDIKLVRHVVTPSISFSYVPDFSDSFWGYYQGVQDSLGQTVKMDRFKGTQQGGSQSLGFSVRNLFQMKTGSGEKEKKLDLFTVDFNTGYNFKSIRQRLSGLSSYMQANPLRNFSLSASTTHSFYQWDETTRTEANRYLFKDNPWTPWRYLRFTSLNVNFSLRLEGKGKKAPSKESDPAAQLPESDVLPRNLSDMSVLEENSSRRGGRFSDDPQVSGFDISWRSNLTFNFSLNKYDPNRPDKRYYMNLGSLEMNLTKNWKINYSGQYDLEKRKIAYHRFTFYRNLHCWEAQVDWVPSGVNKYVHFRINVKSPTLRDLKHEQSWGRRSGYGY